MSCELLWSALTAILILAGVSVSSNIATVLSALSFFLNVGLVLFFGCFLQDKKKLRLGLFYRNSLKSHADEQHVAVFFFFGLLVTKVVVVGWQLTLEMGEHSDVESQAASLWRALQATYLLFLFIFMHYSELRAYQKQGECCKPRTGIFLSAVLGVSSEIGATILVAYQHFEADSPLFPLGIFVAQVVYCAWAVLYTWFVYLGLARMVGCACTAHEAWVVKTNGLVSLEGDGNLLNEL